ncbi:MAG: ParB/RepB/Spo0J family partition protein [Clostridia bacterium]|nr:ParB/RepB/Spo0J family partition protein [Clostridia bacterium]
MPKKKNSGLGRGLDVIFLNNSIEENGEGKENQVTVLPISLVDPKADQPRKNFNKAALEELAKSIEANGVLQPILVREYGKGRYQIIAGERRFRACKIAGVTEIPAIILDMDDKKVAEISLIENIQREDLNPIEEAMAFRALAEVYGLTQEEISERVGKSRAAVTNSLRLLDLPEPVLDMIAAGRITAGHGRTLLGVYNVDDMLSLMMRIMNEGLSVRQLEEEVKKVNRPKRIKPERENLPYVDYFREIELRVQSNLGRRVEIKGKGKKKSITLFYEDNEDLDELLKTLCGEDFLEDF